MEGGFLGLLLSPIQLALGEINSVVTAEQAPSAPPHHTLTSPGFPNKLPGATYPECLDVI